MKKTMIFLIMVALLLTASTAFAATATQSLTVSATVPNLCRITSVTNVTFTTPYDTTDSVQNDSGQGDFTFRCTRGTNYDLYITGTRQMTNGTDNLNYELYQEAGRTTLWPAAAPGVTGTAPSIVPITHGIYGRIPALQDVSVGNYSGTVTITVEY
jgi:spore coat protein U-like protein